MHIQNLDSKWEDLSNVLCATEPYYFISPVHTQTLFKYKFKAEKCEHISDQSLSLGNCVTIQLNETLYAFNKGPKVTCYFADLETNKILPDGLTRSQSFTERYLEHFAVANYRNKKAYVTGGYDRQYQETTNAVSTYGLDENPDHWDKMVCLNKNRSRHGTCSLGPRIFVFGGESRPGEYEASIETYDVEDKSQPSWDLILEPLMERRNPAVSPINGTEIVILGGDGPNGYLSDVLILDISVSTN